MNDAPKDAPPSELTAEQTRWGLAAAIMLIIAIGLLGYALASGLALAFAIGWIVLQVFGYAGALRVAKGDLAHPLFKSQVILHIIALLLLIGVATHG